MNKPPTDGIRVDAAVLRKLVEAIFTKLTLPAQHAAVIAELLVDTDLRGVVSPGVQSVCDSKYFQTGHFVEGAFRRYRSLSIF